MMRFGLLLFSCAGFLSGQLRPFNYDESKVGTYTLPDPLMFANGKPVKTPRDWMNRRRPELLELFANEMFGRTPTRKLPAHYQVTSEDRLALNGAAIRKQVTITFSDSPLTPRIHLLLYLPAIAKTPVPVVLALNFDGNQTISAEPGITLNDVWVRQPGNRTKMIRKPADPKTRGAAASRWPLEKIIAHGFGLATVYSGDIEPDFDGGLPYGVRPLFFREGQTGPEEHDWGCLGAWAWGLSRTLDYLETDQRVDADHVLLMGHSRMGKAALWAGAQDPRFAIVISNESGEGGAAISKRDFGEAIEHLNAVFPHWYSRAYRKYSGHPDQLPFDAHELIALIAPRPLYVSAAHDDLEADAKGQFLAAAFAGPVYQLLGKQGLGTEVMPGLEQPIVHTIAFHERRGKHDVTAYDWDQYLKFADMQWK
jgi:hypothetical protein